MRKVLLLMMIVLPLAAVAEIDYGAGTPPGIPPEVRKTQEKRQRELMRQYQEELRANPDDKAQAEVARKYAPLLNPNNAVPPPTLPVEQQLKLREQQINNANGNLGKIESGAKPLAAEGLTGQAVQDKAVQSFREGNDTLLENVVNAQDQVLEEGAKSITTRGRLSGQDNPEAPAAERPRWGEPKPGSKPVDYYTPGSSEGLGG